MKKEVILYTDGACSGNPGPGGWSAILMWEGKVKELSGYEPNTTNNRMELMGVIKGIEAVKENCIVKVHSDSAYIINAFLQGWIDNWIKNKWKKSDKKPVENQDLWLRLLDAISRHEIQWVKVKGHSTDEYNNRADELAVQAIKLQRR